MKKNLKILIVDDDLSFVQTLEETLVSNSYSVVTASDRIRAEDMIRSQEPV